MTDLNKELERAVELAKLLNREVGNEEQLFLQANLLVEEGISELAKAVFESDRTQKRDALADTLVIAAGGCYISGFEYETTSLHSWSLGSLMAHAAMATAYASVKLLPEASAQFSEVIDEVEYVAEDEGINLAADLKAVNDSNLSKFCLTIAEGIDTQQQYLTQFNLESELKETGNERYPYAVYSLEEKGNFKIGKLLKSINYKAPVFEAES